MGGRGGGGEIGKEVRWTRDGSGEGGGGEMGEEEG